MSLSAEAFAKLDASRDGKVTQEEISAAMSEHGKDVYSHYVSKKKAGASSLDLLGKILGESATQNDTSASEKAARKYMKRMDADKDGVLSKAETSVSAPAFSAIDTSGNDVIELEEMQAALKAHETKLSSYFSSLTESSSNPSLQKKI
ncbi:MAG: hypothetical protein CVU60_12110 [Deltaproteobacteria bacterium HGW-Deltaproteobacteria-18]|nr:MAG: hypothetical protein CVU60_12110 [Deltaproteobacteria bacterium HGW-Deltaproteobacteria-18]